MTIESDYIRIGAFRRFRIDRIEYYDTISTSKNAKLNIYLMNRVIPITLIETRDVIKKWTDQLDTLLDVHRIQ